MKKMMLGVVIGVCLLWWESAWASLYCAVEFSGRRCQFVDLESCRKAVEGTQGSCVLNKESLMAPRGGGPFCLTEQWKTECIYQDRAACEKVAAPQKAICITNPNMDRGVVPEALSEEWKEKDAKKGRNYLPSPDYFPTPGHR